MFNSVVLVGYVKVKESLYTYIIIGPTPFGIILIQGQICLGMKVLAWCIKHNDIENKNMDQTPIPYYYQTR